jgi:hypothetical protein
LKLLYRETGVASSRGRADASKFLFVLFQYVQRHIFWIRGGGEAALLLAKPAASGDACASPQGGCKKMRLSCRPRVCALHFRGPRNILHRIRNSAAGRRSRAQHTLRFEETTVAADSFIGVYSSLTPARGRGGAAHKRYWFVWDCGDDGYRVQALNGAFVPQGEIILVDPAAFAASFSEEPTILAVPLSRADPASQPDPGEGRAGMSAMEDRKKRAKEEIVEAEKNLRAHFAAQIAKMLQGEEKRNTLNALKSIAEVEEGIVPEHKHMFADFCVSLRKSNLPEIALEHAKRALSLAPDDGNAHFNIARIYHALGKLDEAEQHLLTSLDLDPQLEYSRKFLAHIGRERRLKGRGSRRRGTR